MQLTPHFSLAELVTTSHTDLADEQLAGAQQHLGALRSLAELLEQVRSLCGDHPLIIHSGYRCSALNTRIGGSPTSQHMRGEAADFHVRGVELEHVFAAIRQSGLRWGQLILEGHRPGRPEWIHLSLGAPWRAPERCQQVLVYDGTRYRPP